MLQEVRNILPHLFQPESTILRPFFLRATVLTEKYLIHFSNTIVEISKIYPQWCATGMKVCTGMFHVRKSEMFRNTAAKALFLDHLTSHNESTIYYTDESRNEHGPGSHCLSFCPDRARDHSVWLSQCTPGYT
ncbi:hypothetical protein FHG87_013829 [Trinorchestia longiramus]|nr:hypothetical protein FHG87_013829 [Trinorchestia longiramus]